MSPKHLTEAEERELCLAAKTAWSKISPNARKATFIWRSKKFIATHTTFAIRVETPDGTLVTGMYD